MSADRKVIELIQVSPFLFEMRSERMVDAFLALYEAGFEVTYIKGSMNRYRIEDRERPE